MCSSSPCAASVSHINVNRHKNTFQRYVFYQGMFQILPRPCPQAQLFSQKKHKNIPFPPKKRYIRRSAWRSTVQGSTHTWTLKKKHSFTHSFFPATQLSPPMLAVLLVVMLVVVLLSYCCCCLHLLCCRVASTAAATTVGTPLPPPPPLVGKQDDACWRQGWRASEGRGNEEGNSEGDKGGKQ